LVYSIHDPIEVAISKFTEAYQRMICGENYKKVNEEKRVRQQKPLIAYSIIF
jgi:hypothetical protein